MQFGIVPLTDQRGHLLRVTAHAREPFAQAFRREAEKFLISFVGEVVQAFAQQLAAWQLERCLQLLAVFRLDDMPVIGLEHFAPATDTDAGNDAVKTLAIDVHDPQDVLQIHQRGFGDGFPDRAFVQLGIAHQADVTPLAPGVRTEVHTDIFLGHGRKIGGAGAKSHRARRKIGMIRIFGAAGIRLQALERAQFLQVFGIEIAEQKLQCVENGARRGVLRPPCRRRAGIRKTDRSGWSPWRRSTPCGRRLLRLRSCGSCSRDTPSAPRARAHGAGPGPASRHG